MCHIVINVEFPGSDFRVVLSCRKGEGKWEGRKVEGESISVQWLVANPGPTRGLLMPPGQGIGKRECHGIDALCGSVCIPHLTSCYLSV